MLLEVVVLIWLEIFSSVVLNPLVLASILANLVSWMVFATSKARKSTRGNTCCQLFVSDKGFLYSVPMPSKRFVLQALKQFTKVIGAPEAIICDHSGEQATNALKAYCNDLGTTL